MFWGVAFGWELATGYPWGFWKGPGYDLVAEGKERFVKKTAKIRAHAKKLGIYLAHEIHPGTAAMCADDFNLRKWETATGKPIVDYKLSPLGVKLPDDPGDIRKSMEMGLNYGTFSPDGSRYVLPVGGFLHLFDVETGKDVQQVRNLGNLGVSFSLAISPDGTLILQRGMNGGKSKNSPFTLYDLATGQPKLKLEFPIEPVHQHIGPVAFSPDGKLFAVVTSEPERQIRLYSMGGSKEAGVIQGFRGNVESLCFTADGLRLISGMDDTTALVWDLKIALARGKQ